VFVFWFEEMTMRGLAMGAGAIAVLLLGAWIVAGYVPVRGIEKPKYEIVARKDGYEIRQYPAMILARATISGEYKKSLNKGFSTVADYIFGNNTTGGSVAMTAPVLAEQEQPSQKIAMTAPVLSEKAGESYTISFVMPSEYTLEGLPKPNNADVRLEQVPPRKYAVLKFGGYAPESKAKRKTQKLLDALNRDGIDPIGEPTVAQYEPPWTPPFMRHNEIFVEIR
jgi:hypothetical protein